MHRRRASPPRGAAGLSPKLSAQPGRRRWAALALLAAAVTAAAVTALVAAGSRGARAHHGAGSAGAVPVGGRVSSAGARAAAEAEAAREETGGQLQHAAARGLGELVVSRYVGVRPDAALLRRVRRGQVGGVILFGENTAGGLAVTAAAVSRLQDAARRGGSYPLLIMTDQEGGTVKRFAEIPPARSAQEAGSTAQARAEGVATGQALRAIGVNVDLAPVADVERGPGSFLGSRSFGSDPRAVAERACAFADGLAEMGVAYTLKHFPGLGTAVSSTDLSPVSIETSRRQLRASYGAYRRCGRGPRGLVMISSAGYPQLTRSDAPAVVSPEVYGSELRAARITLPTISDDLDAPAMSRLDAPARRALNAGLDLLLFAGSESASADAYALLAGDLRRGSLDALRVARAAESVTRLKEGLRWARPQSLR